MGQSVAGHKYCYTAVVCLPACQTVKRTKQYIDATGSDHTATQGVDAQRRIVVVGGALGKSWPPLIRRYDLTGTSEPCKMSSVRSVFFG